MKSGFAGFDLQLDQIRALLRYHADQIVIKVECVDRQAMAGTNPREPEAHCCLRKHLRAIELLLCCAEGQAPE